MGHSTLREYLKTVPKPLTKFEFYIILQHPESAFCTRFERNL